MNREGRLIQVLQSLKPIELVIEDESHMHSRGLESHFKVLIVSEIFEGLNRVERHQKVNAEVREEFDLGLHALAIRALTPAEFEKMGAEDFKSPACAHSKT